MGKSTAIVSLLLLTPLSQGATVFTGLNISFDEPAFPTATTTVSGPQSYNVINDTTGSKIVTSGELSSLVGDQSDLLMTFQSTTGPLGSASWQWQPEFSGRFLASHGFSGTVAANNPGSISSNTITLTFGEHLTITDLSLRAQSVNTRGVAWEYSVIEFLRPDGSSFTAAPTIGSYAGHTAIGGSPSVGWYVIDSKATVTGVGGNQTASGANGTRDNIAGLGYADVGLAAGTEIGGIRITTYLQDVRGRANGASSFTSSFIDFTISGSIVPEPTSAMLLASGTCMMTLRRRRISDR